MPHNARSLYVNLSQINASRSPFDNYVTVLCSLESFYARIVWKLTQLVDHLRLASQCGSSRTRSTTRI
jgi:hypothetical protein